MPFLTDEQKQEPCQCSLTIHEGNKWLPLEGNGYKNYAEAEAKGLELLKSNPNITMFQVHALVGQFGKKITIEEMS